VQHVFDGFKYNCDFIALVEATHDRSRLPRPQQRSMTMNEIEETPPPSLPPSPPLGSDKSTSPPSPMANDAAMTRRRRSSKEAVLAAIRAVGKALDTDAPPAFTD